MSDDRQQALARKCKAMRRNVRGLQRALERARVENDFWVREANRLRHEVGALRTQVRLMKAPRNPWKRLFGVTDAP